MNWLVCWLIIHTSADKFDSRQYVQIRGYVMKEYLEVYKMDFHDEFVKKHINLDFNPQVQWVHDHECHSK